MRHLRFFGLILICLMLLGLVVVAGCGGTVTPGTTSGNPPTTASDATTTTAALASAGASTTTIAGTATTPSGSSAASGATPTSGGTPTSAGTPVSGPDAGTTSTFPNGLPAPIAPEEIKNCMVSLEMGSADQLQIYDYKNFGHYAAAYVMAADENVYLVLLNDETGGWVILNSITGLDWEAVKAQLRATGAPEDLIEWANPGEG